MSKATVKMVTGFSEYAVTKTGQVISYKKGKETIMAPSTTNGYEKVTFTEGDKKYNYQVHRLVAEMFVKNPNPKDYNIVNHIDGNKMNNHASNLEWTNRKGNAKHYETEIKPKNVNKRKDKAHNDILTRMKIISHAQAACTGNPELFQTIVAAALKDCKGI